MIYKKAAIQNINQVLAILREIKGNTELIDRENEIAISLINSVHAVTDWYERMIGNVEIEEDKILKGMMYLNNQLKHDKSLEIFSANIYENRYPIIFPYKFGSFQVVWHKFPDNGRERSRAKRKDYECTLMGKSVAETLVVIKTIIEKYCD